jgi:hypothetical protein
MAKLIVKKAVRTSCEMEIFIDEQKIGVISDKEPKEFEIAAGKHTFLAKTKWFGSADFTFVAHEGTATRLTISDKQNSADILVLFAVLAIFGVIGANGQQLKLVNLIVSLVICILVTVAVCVFYLRTLGTNERMEVKEI